MIEKKSGKQLYFKELDALRFFAFLFVFLAHSFYSKIPAIQAESIYQTFRFYGHIGIYGVNFFFVLSGFLITYLLLREKDLFGRINIGNFYIRRILRIWPLYFLIIFIGFVMVPYAQHLLGNPDYTESARLWPYLTFVNNFYPEPSSAILGVLWSIAVEEQFYAFWPLILFLFPTRSLPYIFFSLISFSLVWRTFILGGWGYSHSISCMSDLCVGSLMAYVSYYRMDALERLVKLKRGSIVTIYILGSSLFLFRNEVNELMNSTFFYNNERLLFSMFFSFIIFEQTYCKNSFLKVSSIPYISRLGVISYGLYMIHFCSIYIVSKVSELLKFNSELYQVLLLEPIVSLVLTILLAEFSYRYFEKFFLDLKNKFSSFENQKQVVSG
jgi:peptidoglycan/LPS O-acetylase OafA/YrhL